MIVGRCTTASPRPWSTSSWQKATKTAARATRPKSTGVSRRANRTKITSPSSWLPQVSISVQVRPRATRRCRPPVSLPCALGCHDSVGRLDRLVTRARVGRERPVIGRVQAPPEPSRFVSPTCSSLARPRAARPRCRSTSRIIRRCSWRRERPYRTPTSRTQEASLRSCIRGRQRPGQYKFVREGPGGVQKEDGHGSGPGWKGGV